LTAHRIDVKLMSVTESKATTVRFSEEVYERLEKASQVTGLPINSIVVVAALEWLDAHPPETVGGRGLPLAQWRGLPPGKWARMKPLSMAWPSVSSAHGFDTFSRSAQSALLTAQRLAEEVGADYVGTSHLAVGLSHHGLAARVLAACGVTAEALASRLVPQGQEGRRRAGLLLPSSRVRTVIRLAVEEAERTALAYVGSEHLLLGLLVEGESDAARALNALGASLDQAREEATLLRSEEET
jgi:Clp amino terminal domain, pathogenicity island component